MYSTYQHAIIFLCICNTVTDEIPEENIAMYVGLIAAVAVFITVIIIVIFILRRKVKGHGK